MSRTPKLRRFLKLKIGVAIDKKYNGLLEVLFVHLTERRSLGPRMCFLEINTAERIQLSNIELEITLVFI